MKTFKTILRILVAIFIGIPTLPLGYIVSLGGGIVLAVFVMATVDFIFGWLIDDKYVSEEYSITLSIVFTCLTAPIMFWVYFTQGKNPIKVMGI